MSMHFGNIAAQAAADGVISAEEILALRGAGWDDGKMEPEEAEALFVANDALTAPSAEWCDFFVEALSEFVVNTVEPHGYVDQDMGDELFARIDRDGKVESMAELELLVRVLEKALNVPQSLKDYALKQIETAVLSGGLFVPISPPKSTERTVAEIMDSIVPSSIQEMLVTTQTDLHFILMFEK